MDTVFFTREEIREQVLNIYKNFYQKRLRNLHPGMFLRRLRSLTDFFYVLREVRDYMSIFRAWFLRPSTWLLK